MGTSRVAVVVPGRTLGPYEPLVFYARLAVQARGAAVEDPDWRPPESVHPSHPSPQREAWVIEQVAPVLDRLGGSPLLVGKSLGTFASALAADRGLPAIWYTPLLRDDLVVASLRRCQAPFLLVGGTGDPDAWDGAVARSLTPYVCEIAGADHTMIVPEGLRESAQVLGEITAVAERFLDEVVWPA
jgi:hypothetical protein